MQKIVIFVKPTLYNIFSYILFMFLSRIAKKLHACQLQICEKAPGSKKLERLFFVLKWCKYSTNFGNKALENAKKVRKSYFFLLFAKIDKPVTFLSKFFGYFFCICLKSTMNLIKMEKEIYMYDIYYEPYKNTRWKGGSICLISTMNPIRIQDEKGDLYVWHLLWIL